MWVVIIILVIVIIYALAKGKASNDSSSTSVQNVSTSDNARSAYVCEETIQDQHLGQCLARFCYEIQWIREHDSWRSEEQHGSILVGKDSDGLISIRGEYDHDFNLHVIYERNNRNEKRFLGQSISENLDEFLIYDLKGIDDRNSVGGPDLYLKPSAVIEYVNKIGNDVIVTESHQYEFGGALVRFKFH